MGATKENFLQLTRKRDSIKLIREDEKVKEINAWLQKNHHNWKAGMSDVSKMYYEDRRKIGIRANSSLIYLFRHYQEGVFDIFYDTDIPIYTSSGTYISNLDYRDWHGQNWITSIKNQHSCGSCSIFSVTATVESLFNLYYNKHLNLDLSEQQSLSCLSDLGNCSSGWNPGGIIDYFMRIGVVEENCFPYSGSDTISCNNICSSSTNLHQVTNMVGFNIYPYYRTIDNLQKMLLQFGPLSGTIDSLHHAMSLVGYYTDSENSVIWIFKNSWGNTWGENGFVNIKTPINHVTETYAITTPVTALIFSESDRVCADMDGDGYYNWGIGTKPATCPDCAPDTPDGNDADPSIGPVNEYGQPILPFTPLTIPDTEVTTSQTWSNNRTICGDLIIKNNATLTLTGTISMQASHRIYVKSGSKLIINGGKTSLAGITVESGGTLTLNGNGIIEIFNPSDVTINVGGVFNHNFGEINVVNPFMPN